jgi:hypothetical protein
VLAIEWAQQFGALFVLLEHRFYGKVLRSCARPAARSESARACAQSVPTADFSSPSLALLTSRQALEDAAYFVRMYNKTLVNPGPWIVFGCSYSGALSAWFREKHSDRKHHVRADPHGSGSHCVGGSGDCQLRALLAGAGGGELCWLLRAVRQVRRARVCQGAEPREPGTESSRQQCCTRRQPQLRPRPLASW